MSKFFCDTNCELWYTDAEELGINVIRMPYTIDDEMYFYDLGKDTDLKWYFDKMREGAMAKTQALNSSEYIEYFEPVFASGEDIIYVTFSHEMSGTFNSMNSAIAELKEKYPDRKITVCDSRNISLGAGYVVKEAAKLHNAGASDEEVASFVESFKTKIKIAFTVDDLKYLVRGGRLSAIAGAMGTILQLKPIIETVDGKLQSTAKANGRKKSIRTLIDKIGEYNADLSYDITLIHADCEEEVNFFKAQVEEKYPKANVKVGKVGPVIGAHCGPNTLGLIFVGK